MKSEILFYLLYGLDMTKSSPFVSFKMLIRKATFLHKYLKVLFYASWTYKSKASELNLCHFAVTK